MPGLSLIWNADTRRHRLDASGYDDYPLSVFNTGAVTIHLEGCIFRHPSPSLQLWLETLAGLVFDERTASSAVRRWIEASDGDFFIVLIHNSSGDIVVINDALGRLPVYCHRTANALVVTRDLRVAFRQTNLVAFDRLALAQCLLFGYPIGQRTVLADVQRLRGGTVIRITGGLSIREDHVCNWNVDAKQSPSLAIEDNVDRLVSAFLEACAARHTSLPQILSLSGGFDSRAIAAGLQRCALPFRAITYVDHLGGAEHDARVAEELAAALGFEWEVVRLAPPRPADALKLLRLKSGMNPLGMAYLMPFLQMLRERYGPLHFLTGELGTFLLPDPLPPRRFASLEELTDYLVVQHARFSLDDVASLTGLPAGEIRAELRGHLATLPETDLQQKYVHFVTWERGLGWGSEGEDRNRCYFWTTTPFAALEFFETAVQCPDEQKKAFRLYGMFLQRLSPAAAAIDHAGLRSSVGSSAFAGAVKALAALRADPSVRRRLEENTGRTRACSDNSPQVTALRMQTKTVPELDEYFPGGVLDRFLRSPVTHTPDQLDQLLTVTSTIEDLATGTSVLEQFG